MTDRIMRLEQIGTMLLSCLCTAATGAANPPQHCCLRIGDEIIQDADIDSDLCCEGLAYVSFGNIYPVSDGFPEPDVSRQATARCSFPSWGVDLRMGIMRCAPVGGEHMLTCEDWTAMTLQSLADAQTLAEAACCFRSDWMSLELGLPVILGTISTTPPIGGCIERFTTIQVQTPNCPSCG